MQLDIMRIYPYRWEFSLLETFGSMLIEFIRGDATGYLLEGIRKSTHYRGYERVPIRGDTKEYPLEGMRTITHKRESQRLQIRRDVKDHSKDISLQVLWNTSQTHFISSSRYTLLHWLIFFFSLHIKFLQFYKVHTLRIKLQHKTVFFSNFLVLSFE